MYKELDRSPFQTNSFLNVVHRQNTQDSETVPIKKDPYIPVKKYHTTKGSSVSKNMANTVSMHLSLASLKELEHVYIGTVGIPSP